MKCKTVLPVGSPSMTISKTFCFQTTTTWITKLFFRFALSRCIYGLSARLLLLKIILPFFKSLHSNVTIPHCHFMRWGRDTCILIDPACYFFSSALYSHSGTLYMYMHLLDLPTLHFKVDLQLSHKLSPKMMFVGSTVAMRQKKMAASIGF